MTEAALTDLKAAVETEPRSLSLPFSTWTCGHLAHYLGQKGHTVVTPETIRRHLKALGYRLLRPVLSIASPDPQYEAKVQELEVLKQQATSGEIALLYEDEVDLNLLPGVLRCWSRKGHQRKVKTPGKNQKRYGFGAVDWVTGRLFRDTGEHKDSDSFCRLVGQVMQETQGPVVLIIDNYLIHKSKKTEVFVKSHEDRLRLFSLPTYSPHLNAIELLWKELRRNVTHNHLYNSIEGLLDAAEDYFHSLDQQPGRLLSIIGHPA